MPTSNFSLKDTNRLRVKECKKSFQANANLKRHRGTYSCIRQIDFKLKVAKRGKKP